MAVTVLYISQYYDPEQPSVRWQSLTKGLKEKGYEVEVLTSFPSYPYGRVFDGYKTRLYQREVIDGVNIIRVPSYPSKDKSILRRMLTYLSFSFSACCIGIFLIKRPHIILAYHPPATVSIPVIFFKRWFRVPAAYDIQDIWPDTLFDSGFVKKNKFSAMIGRYMQFVYKEMNLITVISNGFKDMLIERGVPESKIRVIFNWAIEMKNDSEANRNTTSFKEDISILFAGTMGKAQGLSSVLNAIEYFQQVEPSHSKIGFYFMGIGTEKESLIEIARTKKLERVYFMDLVKQNEVRAYLEAADILFIHLRNSPLFEITIPGKFQSYCAVGKPLLVGVGGELANIVEEGKCGWVFQPENKEQMVERLKDIARTPKDRLKEMSEVARNLYQSRFATQVGVTKFSNVIEELLSAEKK